jgi:UDP-N-acetylmuramoyl-tripeptide--D-alanyl-D-alanine ligase
MSAPLWTLDEIVAATGATLDLPRHAVGASAPKQGDITGVSIDTRTIELGDLFVALADIRDGHEFVTIAFEKHAAAALVKLSYTRQLGDGALLRVDDPLRSLEALGIAARKRLSPDSRVIAVTGSAGKTTTKEMLRACLTPLGKTHASEKSYNNHWGVPLTSARMPADTRYAVFEIGMNHAGEITPLTKMVRPHVAMITTVEAVHLEHFGSVEAIAEAKAEIFAGLEPSGTAIIPRDNANYGLLKVRLQSVHLQSDCVSFGQNKDADIALSAYDSGPGQTNIVAIWNDQAVKYRIGMRGLHNVINSLAVFAALDAVELDAKSAIQPLSGFHAPPGRGSLTPLQIAGKTALIIDESYNANPASMRAALSVVGLIPNEGLTRRIVVLGDMLELGPRSAELHAGLVDAIQANGIDLVFAAGPNMRHLYDALPPAYRGRWAETSAGLEGDLLATVRGGDVVMIKGSNGSRMAPLVQALIARHNLAKVAT